MTDTIDKKNDENRNNVMLIRLLKIVILSGLFLILLGICFHLYNDPIKAMGVIGLMITACCVAIGMIMSLPSKMYLTFILVNREQESTQAKRLKDALQTKITT
ncbi:MAG: putative membrane-anchored protein [Patiriisocius sp.]|jgi:uncharacterized membrane-anchored protein